MTSNNTAPAKAEILIVDDSPENLLLLSNMLEHFGYSVCTAGDGESALDQARRRPPDLIMMDVNMPGIDGYETTRQLKRDARTANIPVIFLSALADVADKVRAFEVGGVDYVTKPFQVEEVLARLVTHLSIRRLQVALEQKNHELAQGVNELRHAQLAEREQRILAESLRDTIAAINSTLDTTRLLDLILDNLARVVPHEAAYIALIEEDGFLQVRGAHGYREYGIEDAILSLRAPLGTYPSWRKAAQSRKTVVITDTHLDTTFQLPPQWHWIRSTATTPIQTSGALLGMLNLDSAAPDYFTPESIERLQIFADYAAVAIEKARLFEKIRRQAITDELTGLFNRRQILNLAAAEYQRARRYRHPLAVMMIDIDRFKKVNDTYGHPVGDQVLAALANCCRANLRSIDVIGRYGGEEFLVVMPETGLEHAVEAGSRLRTQVEALRLPTERGQVSVTISLGAAALPPDGSLSLEQLIINADDALYAAKAAGRNRVRGFPKP